MDLLSALTKIKIVYQEYQRIVPGGFTTQTSAFWLQRAIEAYSQTSIAIKLVDWHPHQIKGRIDRYVDPTSGASSAEIIISSRLNYCWTKFVGIKEMSHLVIDTYDGSVLPTTVNDVQSANKLISDLISSVDPAASEKSPQYYSEMAALHCAIELMFPIAHRINAQKRLAAGDPTTSIHSLALEYRMPKHYVEISLNEAYMQVVGGLALQAEREVNGE